MHIQVINRQMIPNNFPKTQLDSQVYNIAFPVHHAIYYSYIYQHLIIFK